MDKLKLYVWENALADYYPGIMFALAESADEARELIKQEAGSGPTVCEDLAKEPRCIEAKAGFAVWGGG